MVISAPRRRRSPPWFGTETRRALVAGAAVAGLALLAGWPYWRDHPAAAAATMASCAAIAVVGVLLATGPRTRRTGLLFAAASVFWAVNWAASWDATIGPIMSPYAQADFYLALAVGVLLYPGGRLEYLGDRIWTGMACLVLWGCPTALWVTSEPEWAAFRGESVWWPALYPDLEVFKAVLQVSAALYLLLALSFAVVLLLRLPRMGRLRRVLALPVTVAIGFVGVSAAFTQKPIMEASIPLDDLLHVYVIQGAVVVLVPLTLLASGLRVRIAELTVAGRMLRLTAPVSVERIRDALRDVLHDPTLELWFWAPAEGGYVDTCGRPVDLGPETGGADEAAPDGPAGEGGRWRHRVRGASGEPLAVVELGGALRDHGSLVEAALVAGGRALETARLQVGVQAGLEQVRAAYRRLVRAEAAERERLARDLHDGAQQRLLALGAMLGTLEAVTGDPAVKEHARACRAELKEALASCGRWPGRCSRRCSSRTASARRWRSSPNGSAPGSRSTSRRAASPARSSPRFTPRCARRCRTLSRARVPPGSSCGSARRADGWSPRSGSTAPAPVPPPRIPPPIWPVRPAGSGRCAVRWKSAAAPARA